MFNPRLDRVKQVIKDYYRIANCGMFFLKNFVGDQMETIYDEDGIQIDLCRECRYFEVFGLSDDEQKEIECFYYTWLWRIKNE